MKNLTEHIPPSLQVYVDQFDDDPIGTIERLEQHVNRRNIGAVGYYFLAHFCHKIGKLDRAKKYAWTAKILAPGSPHLQHFHYYISHPDSFKAWKPVGSRPEFKKDYHRNDRPHPIQDLDNLITKLSAAEKERIKLSKTDNEDRKDLGLNSSKVDDIVTETLANIHEKQKNYSAALNTYQQLLKTNPSRKEFYEKQIARLKKKDSEKNKE